MGNISQKNFSVFFFEKQSNKSKPFLIQRPTTINQKTFMMGLEFFSLLKMPAEMSKNSSNQELLICKNIDSDVSYFEVYEFNKKHNN